MPYLTTESLDDLTASIEAHHAANTLRHEATAVWALHYGTDISYLVDSRYTQLVGTEIRNPNWQSTRREGGTVGGPSVREQLETLLAKVDQARGSGREYDIVIFTERERRGLGNEWAYGATVDQDVAACEKRAAETPKHYKVDPYAEMSCAEAARSVGGRVMLGPESTPLLECLECGATYQEPGHVEECGMGCERCA